MRLCSEDRKSLSFFILCPQGIRFLRLPVSRSSRLFSSRLHGFRVPKNQNGVRKGVGRHESRLKPWGKSIPHPQKNIKKPRNTHPKGSDPIPETQELFRTKNDPASQRKRPGATLVLQGGICYIKTLTKRRKNKCTNILFIPFYACC